MKPRRALPLLFAALTQIAAPAFAQSDAEKATARELAKEGSEALDRRDFAVAADKFTRADAIFHAPTLVLGLARANVGLGKLVAAQEGYYDILREPLPPNAPEAFVQALTDAKKDLQALAPTIPWVIINLKGMQDAKDTKDVKLTIDGEPVPPQAIGVKFAVDPGEHKVRVTAKGFKPKEATFTIAASVTSPLDIALEPAPLALNAPEPKEPSQADAARDGRYPPQKIIALTALGVGGASLIAGAVTGVFAVGRYIDLVGKGCTNGSCPAQVRDGGDLASYHTIANISTGTLIGGGALAATGVILLLLTPTPAPTTKAAGAWISPVIGLGQVGLTGRF